MASDLLPPAPEEISGCLALAMVASHDQPNLATDHWSLVTISKERT